jgi:hypothetical protein
MCLTRAGLDTVADINASGYAHYFCEFDFFIISPFSGAIFFFAPDFASSSDNVKNSCAVSVDRWLSFQVEGDKMHFDHISEPTTRQCSGASQCGRLTLDMVSSAMLNTSDRFR